MCRTVIFAWAGQKLLTGRPWLDGPLHTRANLMALLYVTGVR